MTHPGTTARGERCRIPANVGGTGKCLKVLMVELIWFDGVILKEHSGTSKHDRSWSYEWWENDEFQLLASLSAFILHFSEAPSMFRCHASGRDCPECGSQATGSAEESHCSSHLTFPNQCKCIPMVVSAIWVSCGCLKHSARIPLALSRGFTPCRVSLINTKAGKFDIVFDNNVRKLEEIQPVVQGIKAKLSGHEFQQLLAFSFGCVVWWMAGKGWMPAIHHDEQCRCVWTYWSLDLKRQVCVTWWFCLECFDCDSFFPMNLCAWARLYCECMIMYEGFIVPKILSNLKCMWQCTLSSFESCSPILEEMSSIQANPGCPTPQRDDTRRPQFSSQGRDSQKV